MISSFFIARPKAAIVISVIIVLLGIIALQVLPVKEYPTITPPQITVTINYPGTDSETIAKAVAAPIEEAINGVENMLYMVSASSSSGVYTLNVFFEVGTDPNIAKMDVNNRIQLVLPRLPEEVRRQGVMVRERSPDFLKVIAFYSEGKVRDPIDLSNYIILNIVDEIKRIPGVGDVIVFDEKRYSIRVWLSPDKLYHYKLSPVEVYQAITKQNQQFSAGVLGGEPLSERNYFTFSVKGEPRFESISQFQNIILKELPDGAVLRLKDVAKIELSSETFSRNSFFKKQPVIPVGIFLSTGANALEVSDRLDKLLAELKLRLPPDIKYYFPYDPTIYIKESVKEVIFTLLLAVLLVIFVIFLFLGHVRATLIPVLAIPVSILGTFAVMYALGFSINLLTLFGLILAIGLVVDDAIIVIENVERIMREEGLPPREASLKAMEEISSPVIAIVLVLSAVFIPASFVGGFTGRFYQQFAITIATSMILSGLVALTLTPALCAYILKEREKEPLLPIKVFQDFFELARKSFVRNVNFILKRPLLFASLFLLTFPLTYLTYKRLPTGLVPLEDKSALLWFASLPPGSSLKRTEELVSRVEELFLKTPEIERYVAISGLDFQGLTLRTDSAGGFIGLYEWGHRPKKEQSSFSLAQRLSRDLRKEKEALIFVVNPPPIMGLGRTGGFELYIQDRLNRGTQALHEVTQNLIMEANRRPELFAVRTNFDPRVPYYSIKVDREKAYAYGVEVEDVYKALAMTSGASYVNDFNLYGRVYRIYLQAEGAYRNELTDYSKIFVKNKQGTMIPLSNLIKIERTSDTLVLERFNMFTSSKILGEAKPGYSSGEALNAIIEVAKKVLPEGYTISFAGASLQELRVKEKSSLNLLYAVVFVYLILVALYESWSAPLAVMLSIPFAILGAALTLNIFKLQNDIYFQVGLITLIGLSAKNAILIVEFAEERFKRGMDLISATLEGARLRFRPIVMTSFAFIAGAIPLALSSGAGSASRNVIGWTVVGGMLLATLIGIFFIPLLYYLIKKITTINLSSVKRSWLLLLIVVGMFFLTSCSVKVEHKYPTLSLPDKFPTRLTLAGEIKERFWEDFGDQQLNKFIEELLKNNDDILIASTKLEQVFKKLTYVERERWPIISYGMQFKREHYSEETLNPSPGKTLSHHQLNLLVNYEIDLFNRLGNLEKAQIHQYLATLAGKKALELSLITNFISNYIGLIVTEQKIKIAENFSKKQWEIYDFRRKQRDSGLLDNWAVLQAQAEWENTLLLLETLKGERELYRDILALLLGYEPKLLFQNKPSVEAKLPPPLTIPALLPSQVLERRPDIIQAENLLRAHEYEIAVAKAEYFPRIYLTSALGFQSIELANLIKASASYWNLAGILSGIALDFGRRKTQVELKEIQRKEALYQYVKTVKNAFFEVSAALNELETIEKKLQDTERKIKTLEELLSLNKLKYEKGLISYLHVIDSERQLLLALLELETLKGERLKKQLYLIKALGGGI
ncbi:MAG: multidrug efflux RND transporter permease subunit [Caldimicrobium sp.]|nr:multidrug efflux RND transporter permease subunit [Caldimicrobium sp.]MCX7873529.1 multidrug efflux RND transporter permease subunit [Caldimicrobium sp.]MDW8094692.1 multidrug efflux RND transporter permease subunit [Caldimicrobium sp.]